METGLLIGAAALALVVWFGFEPIAAGLATIWRSNALEDARLNLWWDALAIVERSRSGERGTARFSRWNWLTGRGPAAWRRVGNTLITITWRPWSKAASCGLCCSAWRSLAWCIAWAGGRGNGGRGRRPKR